MCNLAPLTTDDKKNFDSKCSNLSRYSINSSNVNSNLSKLNSIDIPYGGLDVEKFFNTNGLTKDLFITVNNSLIRLLNNAIVPMNKLKLYHLDLKGPNILVDDRYNTKIIDWGLMGIQTRDEIPVAAKNRPFMYNGPITISVFADEFKTFIRRNINEIKTGLLKPITSLDEIESDIKIMVNNWVKRFINNGYGGHFEYIRQLLEQKLLVNYSNFPSHYPPRSSGITGLNFIYISEYQYLNNYISNALTEVILKYTDLDGNFNDKAYFENVYKYNVDIVGFISTYYDILSLCLKTTSINKLNKKESSELSHNIIKLINKYIFNHENQVNKIDINELINDLTQLNNSFIGSAPAPLPVRAHAPSPAHVRASPRGLGARARRLILVSSRSKSSYRPASKKKRVRRVTCDDAKKAKCLAMGKVCNDATGRCIARK
jgi:hypothetical protein